MGRELPSTLFGVLEAQSYVYNGYLLALSALLILAGALSDYYGRRRMYAIGLIGFGVISGLCGLSPNFEVLIVLRILQGAVGALLVPASLALINTHFEGEERGRAFGVWAAASSATTLLGPLVGGLLVDSVSWRAVFLINVPICLFALWPLRHVAESRDPDASGQFHWLGALTVALAVGGLCFGTIYGQQREWQDPVAYAAIAVGVVATVVLPFQMARARHPLIPLDLFKSPNFTITNISTLLIYGALYVMSYFVPLYLQGTIGYSAAAAGLSLVGISLGLIFLSARFGALAGRFGPRWFMAAGPAIMALGVLWLVRMPANITQWRLRFDDPSSYLPPASYWIDLMPAGVVMGLGLAVFVAPLTTALMSSVPEPKSGLASAINNAVSRVGPQLAGAGIFVAITADFYFQLARRVPGLNVDSADVRARISPLNHPAAGVPPDQVAAAAAASADAFHLAMMITALLLLAGAVVNAVWIQNPQLRPNRVAATEESARTDAALAASLEG
jgi:EmrB/QacA subfamily drug resistance transporter